jgi:hypothetical protein
MTTRSNRRGGLARGVVRWMALGLLAVSLPAAVRADVTYNFTFDDRTDDPLELFAAGAVTGTLTGFSYSIALTDFEGLTWTSDWLFYLAPAQAGVRTLKYGGAGEHFAATSGGTGTGPIIGDYNLLDPLDVASLGAWISQDWAPHYGVWTGSLTLRGLSSDASNPVPDGGGTLALLGLSLLGLGALRRRG